MLRGAALLLMLFAAAPAAAQDQSGAGQSSIYVPPAPPVVAAPAAPAAPPAQPVPAAPPPGLVQTPVPPAAPDMSAPDGSLPSVATPDNSAPGAAAAPNTPATPPPPDVAPVIPNTWLPGNTATLGVLDEVDGSTSKVSIPVGGQAKLGDLTVSVQSCVNRPPDQVPDSAIFLTVQNAADASAPPLFRGWMVRSMPGATVVGDAAETFRVIGCS